MTEDPPAATVGAVHARRQRAGAREGQDAAGRRLILDLEDAVAPDAKVDARGRVCAAAVSGEYGAKEITIRVNSIDTEWHAADLRAVAEAGPVGCRGAEGQLRRRRAPDREGSRGRRRAGPHEDLGDARDTGGHAPRRGDRQSSDRLTVLVMGTNDLAKELHAEHVPGREPLLFGLRACASWPPARPAR